MHVAAYVEQLGRTHAKPTVKQHLAVNKAQNAQDLSISTEDTAG